MIHGEDKFSFLVELDFDGNCGGVIITPAERSDLCSYYHVRCKNRNVFTVYKSEQSSCWQSIDTSLSSDFIQKVGQGIDFYYHEKLHPNEDF